MSESITHIETDWHPEDIKAAIRKRGVSIAKLAEANGYQPPTFYQVFSRKYPKVERIVAEFLDKDPADIWPSRYQEPIKIIPSVHRRIA